MFCIFIRRINARKICVIKTRKIVEKSYRLGAKTFKMSIVVDWTSFRKQYNVRIACKYVGIRQKFIYEYIFYIIIYTGYTGSICVCFFPTWLSEKKKTFIRILHKKHGQKLIVIKTIWKSLVKLHSETIYEYNKTLNN